MNQVNMIGRTTKDPETRYTDSGMAISQFTLAIDRPPNKNGDKQTDFIRCKAFGKVAETIDRYVIKGQQIGVTGSIQTGSYEHKDGYTVYTTDVNVQRLYLIGNKNDSQGGQNYQGGGNGWQAQESPSETKTERQTTWEQLDEDIPF